jgi:hypothetical protein
MHPLDVHQLEAHCMHAKLQLGRLQEGGDIANLWQTIPKVKLGCTNAIGFGKWRVGFLREVGIC